jgi:lipopolysaccharide biosynthesis regulator YciM
MKLTSIALLILSLSPAVLAPSAFADDDTPPASRSTQSAREIQIRQLDEKALWAKKTALRDLMGIAQRNQNPAQAPGLLLRQAELQQEMGAIEYRIAFSKANATRRPANLSAYNAYMRASIAPLNMLLTKYPNFHQIQRIYYLRGKAFTEIGDSNHAIADYKYLVNTWPKSADAQLAYVDLWTFMVDRKDYKGAIEYIGRYGLREDDKYYNIALEKLAWCYYYLGDFEKALRYTETELRGAKGLERDKALANYSLFYSAGLEHRAPGITAANALPRFRSTVQDDDLGKVLVSYAYLLRTKEYDAELNTLKNQAFADGVSDLYLSDLVVVDLENQLNRQRFGDMKHTVEQEIELYSKSDELKKDPKRTNKIKASITEIIPELQKFLAHDPGSSAKALAGTLRLCYQFMLESSGGDNLAKARIHFNMAEVSIEMKDYEGGVAHYRWVVDNVDQKTMPGRKLALDSNVKSIESRYGAIKAQGWTAKELVAKPFTTEPKQLPEPIAQWMGWIDGFPKNAMIQTKVDGIAFEADRLYYSFGYVEKATQRLLDFVTTYPTSSSAVPAASLVLDTYIASQKWQDAHDLAEKFAQIKEFRGTDFQKRVEGISVDTYCKLLDSSYQAKDYATVLKKADEFLATNPNNKRRGDVLELAANSALGMGDKPKAAEYLAKLQAVGGEKTEVVQLALMTNGSIAEEKYNYAAAAKDYLQKVNTTHSVDQEMRTKILLLSWLSGDAALLQSAYSSPMICGKKKDAPCPDYKQRLDKGQAPKGSALAKLQNEPEKLSIKHRSDILVAIPAEWEKIDPLDKYSLLSMLSSRVPASFHELRTQIREAAPVKLDQNSIAKRNAMIETAQGVAEKISELPWTRIKVLVLRDSAGLYDDLAKEIREIKPPKGLAGKDLQDFQQALADASQPFAQKRDELQKTELQLASQPGAEASPSEASSWGTELANSLPAPDKQNQKLLVSAFREALADSNFPKAGFLIQRAQTGDKDGNAVDAGTLAMMKAAILARTGAVIEAMNELKDAPSSVVQNARTRFESKNRAPAGDTPPGDMQ